MITDAALGSKGKKVKLKPIQMLLGVYWQKDGTADRHTRYGTVIMDVGDLLIPPLTEREMQDIAFATKMEFIRVCRSRAARRARKGK